MHVIAGFIARVIVGFAVRFLLFATLHYNGSTPANTQPFTPCKQPTTLTKTLTALHISAYSNA